MHPDLEKLMVLQQYDLEARKLREEIAAFPKLVGALDTKAKAIAGQRAVVIDLIHKEEVLRRSQESDVKDQQAKIARGRLKRDNATNTVQVTALDHEISFAEKEIARLEDAELESMERSEALDGQKAVADKALEQATATHASERARAIATIDRNNLLLAQIDPKRTAQRATVGEAALSSYDRISKSKGTGIAEALNQKCTACQMMIRPQRWNDMRDRDNTEINTCESCGRLLFYDPARDAPQRKPVAVERTESIAAQIVRGL